MQRAEAKVQYDCSKIKISPAVYHIIFKNFIIQASPTVWGYNFCFFIYFCIASAIDGECFAFEYQLLELT